MPSRDSRTIRVDVRVFEYLRDSWNPIDNSMNDTLRRLLNLVCPPCSRQEHANCQFPNSCTCQHRTEDVVVKAK